MSDPVVMISSYPPRLCGIATFCEEAREFLQKRFPDRDVLVISHTDGEGDGVFPIMAPDSGPEWWRPVADKVEALNPYAVHIQHEYGLYEWRDETGRGDNNDGFLKLLDALGKWPVVVEPHTVHGRLRDTEAEFIRQLCNKAELVLFKCAYQKWRLNWTFTQRGWKTPRNIMVVPHGARPDVRYPVDMVPSLRAELGLDKIPHLAPRLVGMVGWIQSNKRWDIVTSMWEDIQKEILNLTGEDWDLLAAGKLRDPHHDPDYRLYRDQLDILEKKGLAHFFEFIPRGEIYYKVMAVCDFILLPSTDETQSGTLARVIALNKPYITTAPLEGLTSQTLESEGGLLFTTKEMLRKKIIRLACDETLRIELGDNLRRYLDEVVSWEVVVGQYGEAYELARGAVIRGQPPELPIEF